jgi:hypothetical protein
VRGAARAAGRWLVLAATAVTATAAATAPPSARVSVRWDEVLRTNRTLPTVQVVATPMLRRDSAIHDQAFAALAALGCEQVRWVPWMPYPRLSVAALEPPSPGVTSWDFSEMDPMLADFMAAQAGRSTVMNFSLIPQWMFVTDVPIRWPDDPREVTWAYQQGTELRDPTLEELVGYYRRILEWYTRGGFVDEWGMWHASGHHYRFDWWEVLNEPNAEHMTTPAEYTRRYDAIVEALRAVDPSLRFVGLAVSFPSHNDRWFKYFLKKKHHRPGVSVDMISYHFYAWVRLSPGRRPMSSVFSQADELLEDARRIDRIRARLWPEVKTSINEAGALAVEELSQPKLGFVQPAIPDSFWNLSAALYAYLYAGLSRLGIDSLGQSALAQYPSQFPSVTMLDWTTGEPNARYWVLKLLVEELGPGDAIVATETRDGPVHAQAYVKPDGRRRLLLVNTSPQPITVRELPNGEVRVVTAPRAWRMPEPSLVPPDGALELAGHGVALIRVQGVDRPSTP